jgi:hypothetical protein
MLVLPHCWHCNFSGNSSVSLPGLGGYQPSVQANTTMPKRVLVGYGIDIDAVSGWYFA